MLVSHQQTNNMICPEFVSLSTLMAERGIEVESEKWLFNESKENWVFINKKLADITINAGYGHICFSAPTIETILTVAFGERVWGKNQYQLNNEDKQFHCDYHLTHNRDVVLYLWDNESNKPLHECPKLCSWLVGEIKNLK